MSSKRLLFATAALTCFAAVAAAQALSTAMGPIEKRAKAITPENPIPRRIHYVAPIYPPEAAAVGASGRINLIVVLDEYGRVAEVRRPVNLPIIGFSAASNPDAAGVKAATEALLQSVADAIRQWQYEAPAEGPLAFTAIFNFANGIAVALASQDPSVAPPPPPARPAALNETVTVLPGQPVRVGGQVRAPGQLRKVNPVYPQEAQDARVQGVVILETMIGNDGRVSNAKILRSIPLLDQAALDAVRQWEYEPTLLNGAPVPVIMTVTVQFTLSK
jgi:protein TonB